MKSLECFDSSDVENVLAHHFKKVNTGRPFFKFGRFQPPLHTHGLKNCDYVWVYVPEKISVENPFTFEEVTDMVRLSGFTGRILEYKGSIHPLKMKKEIDSVVPKDVSFNTSDYIPALLLKVLRRKVCYTRRCLSINGKSVSAGVVRKALFSFFSNSKPQPSLWEGVGKKLVSPGVASYIMGNDEIRERLKRFSSEFENADKPQGLTYYLRSLFNNYFRR